MKKGGVQGLIHSKGFGGVYRGRRVLVTGENTAPTAGQRTAAA